MKTTTDAVARLLATENIQVVRQNMKTAAFDVKERVLYLPLWSALEDPHVQSMLVGHEVGHGLETPTDGWHDAACSRGEIFKGYLNVLEDVRVDKLIQRRYPGLKKSYKKGGKIIFDQGFFGTTDVDEINEYDLIDRINVLSKAGASTGVEFTEEEQQLVLEAQETETWEQVVDLAERIYGRQRELNKEKKRQQEPGNEPVSEEILQEESGGNGSAESDQYQDFDSLTEEDKDFLGEQGEQDDKESETKESETKESGESETEESETGEGDISAGSASAGIAGEYEDEVDRPITEEEYRKNIASQNEYIDDVVNITAPDKCAPIRSYKEIIDECQNGKAWSRHLDADLMRRGDPADCLEELQVLSKNLFDDWKNQNQKQIAYLVKQFEMKKRSKEYLRASVSKTGVIDPVKMNNYLFDDNIFKRVTSLPQGKSHGFIFYCDWSASMSNVLYDTVTQLLNLASFCKKINVPFEVYSFNQRPRSEDVTPATHAENQLTYGTLLLDQFFTNKMKKNEFEKISGYLLAIALVQDYEARMKAANRLNVKPRSLGQVAIPKSLKLQGTPLNHAIVAAPFIYRRMKSTTNVEQINTFFLTDGESSSMDYGTSVQVPGRTWSQTMPFSNAFILNPGMKRKGFLTDPITNKTFSSKHFDFRMGGYVASMVEETCFFLEYYREVTGGNAIGFRIVNPRATDLSSVFCRSRNQYHITKAAVTHLKKNNFLVLNDETCKNGYSDYILLNSQRMGVPSSKMEVGAGASNSRLKTAFSKTQKDVRASRPILDKVVSFIV